MQILKINSFQSIIELNADDILSKEFNLSDITKIKGVINLSKKSFSKHEEILKTRWPFTLVVSDILRIL